MQAIDGRKANCLLIGCGGIGTIAALNLEKGGLATVTAVLRSNYTHVVQHGFNIDSVDHGTIKGWRPGNGMCEIKKTFLS
jgi:ketopantoate reductase